MPMFQRQDGGVKRAGRRWLLASAATAIGIGSLGPGAWAATADATATTTTTAATATTAESGGGSTTLEEVTVTARKKEERLIDVPVAAAVLSNETLSKYNTTDLIQISTLTTGVQIARTGGGTPGAAVYIRGIGVFGPDYASESPVSLVIDGIPITRGHIIDTGFFDQSNIQILKGPQSLFYGKNSPAGVIAINSNSPGDRLEGYLRASYGFNSQDPQIEGAVSVPITNTLAIRLAVRAEDMQGGYVYNQSQPLAINPLGNPASPQYDPAHTDPFLTPANSSLAGPNYDKYPKTKELLERFTAVWKPSSRFDATLKVFGSYYHNDSSTGNEGFPHCQNGAHPFYTGALGGLWEDTNAACPSIRSNDGTVPQPVLSTFVGAPSSGLYYTLTQNFLTSLAVNYRLPQVTFTSVTGYYHLKANEFGNYDSTVFAETPDYQSERTSLWTQEVRAATTFNFPVNFTVGGFYEHERRYLYNTNRIFLLGPLPAGLTGQEDYAGVSNSMIDQDNNGAEDFSFFGSFNWKILPNLELAGGGRWTDAHKKSSIHQTMQAIDQLYGPYIVAQMFSGLTPAGTTYNIGTRYQNFSPEVTLTYHVTPNFMVYAAYKTGFLAGGIANPGVVTNYLVYTNGVFDPAATQANVQSNLTFAPEKVKGEEIGVKGTLFDGHLSGDLTLFHYTYYDLQVATFHANTTTFSIGNAGSAIDQGVEANLTYAVNRDLSLRGSITYVPLRYSSFPGSQCYSGQTPATGCLPSPSNPSQSFQDLSHKPFGGPPLSINLGATWNKEITSEYSVGLTGDLEIYDATPLVNNAPNTSTPGYAVLNMSARYFPTNGPWEISLIGTNLNDDRTLQISGAKPLGLPQDLWGEIPPGREIRLQFDYKF
jgi:outer membrane receptor protein involved in Fe transport